ncbi:S-adenosyl-L-methionine-dependent methyltransferase [Gracilaria domingensis]|nr:S-adenosyl-L-methionine-dependent methyltransferase [Gracilaria domingensis]
MWSLKTCPATSIKTPQVKILAKQKIPTDGLQEEAPISYNIQPSSGKVYAPRQQRGGGRRFRGLVQSQGKKIVAERLPPNPPGLRIASGSVKGRRIRSPNVYLRPMMAKVREAIFSMLETLDALPRDGICLDLFAGCGSVGIEALSRGMSKAIFVDYSRTCVDSINDNLVSCSFDDRSLAVCSRVEEFVRDGTKYNYGRHYDLITITPPYEEVDYSELMKSVAESECVGEGTFVVVEYPVELRTFPPSIANRLVGIRNRRYGRTVIAIYACQPDVDIELRPDEFIRLKRR